MFVEVVRTALKDQHPKHGRSDAMLSLHIFQQKDVELGKLLQLQLNDIKQVEHILIGRCKSVMKCSVNLRSSLNSLNQTHFIQ